MPQQVRSTVPQWRAGCPIPANPRQVYQPTALSVVKDWKRQGRWAPELDGRIFLSVVSITANAGRPGGVQRTGLNV